MAARTGWKRRGGMRRMATAISSAARVPRRAMRSMAAQAAAGGRSFRNAVGALIDNVVYCFAPEMAIRMKTMRMIMEASDQRRQMAAGDRDSGSNDDRLHGAQRWMASRLSPDSALEQSLEETRQRSLELYRDTTAGGAIDSRVDHVIGRGFSVQAKISEGQGISAEAAKGWNDQLEAVYHRWSPACDLTGQDSLWQVSRLVERSIAAYGESFTVMWMQMRPGQPIPLVLEVVDPERIGTPPNKAGDPLCRMGIQYDGTGMIIGYWLRTTHPYDTARVEDRWSMIPADRMLHVYEKWFPGQSRGYSWMSRSINRWRDGEDLDEAGIIAAQVEACNAAFVRTRQPLRQAKGMATGQTTAGNRLEDTVPGKIHYLDADAEDVVFNSPTKSNIVGTLHEWNHRRIAAGMNWPYEFLMKDWRGMSFAGGRLILNGAKITCECEQQLLVVAWFSCIWHELVRLSVLFSSFSGVEINLSRFQQRPWIYQAHQWTGPRWSYAINPGEEVKAEVMAVENNMTTLEEVIAARGGNLEDVLEQRARERSMERELEILPTERLSADTAANSAAEQGAANATV